MPDKLTGPVYGHLSGDEGKLGCLDSRDLHIWRARLAKFDGIEDLNVGHAASLKSGRSMADQKMSRRFDDTLFRDTALPSCRLVTSMVRPIDLFRSGFQRRDE